MKKLLYALILSGIVIYSNAQEEQPAQPEQPKPVKEKKEKVKVNNDLLPSTGDIAIGVDALPYLEFLGNMFSGHDQRNTLNLNNRNTIYGKYYLAPDAAVRAELFLNNSTDIDLFYLQDDANVATNPNAQVEDQRITRSKGVGVGVGYQMYRGYGALRGTYGAALSYYTFREKTEYLYGNKMNTSNTTPTTISNWNTGATTTSGSRNISEIDNGNQTLSVGLIGGVEYFFSPKICIGGEFGIYYALNWTKQSSFKYETIQQGSYVELEQAVQPGEVTSRLTTQVYNSNLIAGRLYVLFHF